jgi:hypothetical protein
MLKLHRQKCSQTKTGVTHAGKGQKLLSPPVIVSKGAVLGKDAP